MHRQQPAAAAAVTVYVVISAGMNRSWFNIAVLPGSLRCARPSRMRWFCDLLQIWIIEFRYAHPVRLKQKSIVDDDDVPSYTNTYRYICTYKLHHNSRSLIEGRSNINLIYSISMHKNSYDTRTKSAVALACIASKISQIEHNF